MKIFRYRFLYILVLVCNFLFLVNVGYADQGDMYCDGWLREQAGNYPTEKDPNESNRTFIKDKKGVKGVCRRKFPTVGEREMLYRVNENSFNNTYVVKRQYCWYFGDWFGFDKCATPKVHIGFLYVHLDWDPPADINWGDDKEVQFGINDIGNDINNDNNCKSIYGSFNHACVVRIGPGQEFPDGTVNNGNRIKVCAYYKSGWGFFIGKSNASKNLIGCIDEPFKPTPPVFNKVILPTKIPLVDTEKPLQKYIDLGSRFDKPMISMYLKNTQGEIEDTINLVYQFEGDRDSNYQKTRCKKFKGYQVTYCAMVSDSNPSQVCACQEGQCGDTKNESISLLGCVPRPTPKDSKIELKATYADNVTKDGQIFPSMNVKFYDTVNQKDLKLSIDNLMEFYGSKQVLPEGLDKQGGNNGKDAWDYRQDSKKVYGVTFNSMIPEKIEEDKGEMEKINVFSPDALLQLSKSDANPEGDQKCCFYAESTDSLQGGNPFVLPAQNASRNERNREMCKPCDDGNSQTGACKKTYTENASCYIQSKKIDYSYNADLAACPGIYVGIGSGKQRKMCLQVNAWKEFFGPNSLMCVDIPSKCRKVENINEISKQSGYAIWDSTQDVDSEKPQIGRCGTAAQGFEETAEVSITTNCAEITIYKSSTESTAKSGNTKKTNVEKDNAAKDNTTNNNPNDDDSKTIDQIATAAAKEKCFNKTVELSKLQNYIKGGDIYFNLPSFQSEENLKYNRENKPPTRQCKTDGTLFGTIQNSCKFISNCVGNTEPVPVTGNTAWESFLGKAGDAVKVTDGEKENTYNVIIGSNSYKGIQSNTTSIQGYNFVDVLIPGICNGVVNNNTTRACRVFYGDDNKVIFSGWTDTIIGEKCSK